MVERRRTHSLLASDIARGWFAVGLGTVALTFALLVARAMFTAGDGPASEFLRPAYYAGWTAFCLAYIGPSVFGFGRYGAIAMRRGLVASAPRGGWLARFWWSMNGGGGVWWALLGATYTFSTLVELTISRTQ